MCSGALIPLCALKGYGRISGFYSTAAGQILPARGWSIVGARWVALGLILDYLGWSQSHRSIGNAGGPWALYKR